jgi:hypothetical protein
VVKTRFRGFSVKKQDFQGLNCKKPGLKHNYDYISKVYSVKQPIRTSGGENREAQGLNRRKQDLTVMIC